MENVTLEEKKKFSPEQTWMATVTFVTAKEDFYWKLNKFSQNCTPVVIRKLHTGTHKV